MAAGAFQSSTCTNNAGEGNYLGKKQTIIKTKAEAGEAGANDFTGAFDPYRVFKPHLSVHRPDFKNPRGQDPVAMYPTTELKKRQRKDYPYVLEYRTRWADNDMYDHMNNSVYNFLFDSVINTYLMEHCGLQPPTSAQHPLMAHTHCDYFSAISFPSVAELGLRVNSLGKSSVTYEVGLFEKGVEGVKAVGEFVHVFVERATLRPHASGMNNQLRDGLQRLLVNVQSSKL